MERTGQASIVASIGEEVGRANYTLFFAKKSWIEKDPGLVQNGPTRRARPGLIETASKRTWRKRSTVFPGLGIDDNVAVVSRYRTVGVPIWATSTVVDPAGLAKAQEIMVVGGVLPVDKKVDYDKIVTNVYADKAQRKPRANEEELMLAPSGSAPPAVAIRDVTCIIPRPSVRRWRSPTFRSRSSAASPSRGSFLRLRQDHAAVDRVRVLRRPAATSSSGTQDHRAVAAGRLHVPEGHVLDGGRCWTMS